MWSKRKIISWLLLIGWMILIAVMSNEPAQVSDSQSMKTLDILQSIGININGIFKEASNFIIRKSAHFLEYAVLGMLFSNVLLIYFENKKLIVLCVFLCALYAVSDEIHQFFVEGRQCALRDVIIDTFGSVCGTVLNTILYKKTHHK